MRRKKRISLVLTLLMLFAALLPAPVFAADAGAAVQGWADVYGDGGRVSVTFTGAAPDILQYVALMDEQGQLISPQEDAPGHYLLLPGRYAYGFHDPEGRYADMVPALLSVDESMAEVEVALSLASAAAEVPAEPAQQKEPAQGENLELSGKPVAVFFRCSETNDFSRLTVYDAAGSSLRPQTDSDSGRVLYDSYLLTPGQYSYRFQDPSGQYGSLSANFTVGEHETQYINLRLDMTLTGQSFSGTFINPVYSGLISEADLPSTSLTPEQNLSRLQQTVEILSGAADSFALNTVYGAPDSTIHDSVGSAGSELKRALLQRETEITVLYGCNEEPSEETWRRLCTAIYNAAIVHNGVSTEGDYLRYEYGGVNCDGAVTSTEIPGVYVYQFVYAPLYFTDAAQEAELAGVTANILARLRVSEMDSAHRIEAIYRYLCENVSYDSSHDNIVFTAYDALVNGRAVCQGVATAFYRLCLEAGVDARVVTDVSSRHAWNIASPDGSHYFALDATWDAGTSAETQQYFLKGSESWLSGHPYGDQFVSGSFSGYDFPAWDYVMGQNTEAVSDAVIHSVSLLFDGRLRIKYYFSFAESLRTMPGACVSFCKNGVEISRSPLSEAREENGLSAFYYSVNVSEIADPVQVFILDGDGRTVEICSRNGTHYPTGFFFSAMEYARQMKSSGSTEAMRSLAEALENYGIAAQIYFKSAGYSGLTLSSYVRNVSAADLSGWEITTDGTKPEGLIKASISAMFEADNSLRLYFTFDGTVDPFALTYTIDGAGTSLCQRSDGAYYIRINNISADKLDVMHTFTVSDGVSSYSVNASVLSYAKTAIERGSSEVGDLGRTLYLYNRAAKVYFG